MNVCVCVFVSDCVCIYTSGNGEFSGDHLGKPEINKSATKGATSQIQSTYIEITIETTFQRMALNQYPNESRTTSSKCRANTNSLTLINTEHEHSICK